MRVESAPLSGALTRRFSPPSFYIFGWVNTVTDRFLN